jgi:hypothetical protein
MDSIVLRLRAEFADSFGVVEVFGTEPYPDQVLLTSSPKGKEIFCCKLKVMVAHEKKAQVFHCSSVEASTSPARHSARLQLSVVWTWPTGRCRCTLA